MDVCHPNGKRANKSPVCIRYCKGDQFLLHPYTKSNSMNSTFLLLTKVDVDNFKSKSFNDNLLIILNQCRNNYALKYMSVYANE